MKRESLMKKVTRSGIGTVVVVGCLLLLFLTSVALSIKIATHKTKITSHGPTKQAKTIELTPSFEVDDSEAEFAGRVDVGWVSTFSPISGDRYVLISLGQGEVGNGEVIAVQEFRRDGETISVKVIVSWDNILLSPAMVTLISEIKVGDKPAEDNLIGHCEAGKMVKMASVIGRYGSRHKESLGVRFDRFDKDQAVIVTSLIR